MLFLSRATQPVSHRVGRSVGLSVGPSHFVSRFAFSAILSYLKVEKFRYECFMDVYAPAQTITAPAQLITARTQPPATELIVYTALFSLRKTTFKNAFLRNRFSQKFNSYLMDIRGEGGPTDWLTDPPTFWKARMRQNIVKNPNKSRR